MNADVSRAKQARLVGLARHEATGGKPMFHAPNSRRRGGMWRVTQVFLTAFLSGALCACAGLPRVGGYATDALTAEEHVKLGTIYDEQRVDDRAEEEFRAALRQRPQATAAFVGLGNLAFRRGAFEEAHAYYTQALQTAPDDPRASNNLAMIYVTRGERLEEAERLVRTALAQEGPLAPYALDTLAAVYRRQGRYADALEALEEAAKIAPPANEALHEHLAGSRREVLAAMASGGAGPASAQ
jgi:tetratricopeptide (TPR) repeat protein